MGFAPHPEGHFPDFCRLTTARQTQHCPEHIGIEAHDLEATPALTVRPENEG